MTLILSLLSFVFVLVTILYFTKPAYRSQIIVLSRLFLALVFIYSGFVKAVDPLGSTYKFVDYFNAFGFSSLNSLAFPLSIILSAAEFIVGVGFLLSSKNRIIWLLASVFMLVFTPLTLFLALKNPVSDCGCFGDAMILTNWETFWKNIVIDIPLLLITFNLKTKAQNRPVILEWSVLSLAILGIVGVSIYGYRHLPIIDFRPFKIGNNIQAGMSIPDGAKADVYKSTFIYKNIKTGEQKEFDEAQLSEAVDHPELWSYVDTQTSLIEEGYHPPIHDFSISNPKDGDITQAVLNDSAYTLILVSYNLNLAYTPAIVQFEPLAEAVATSGIKCLVLTGGLQEEIEALSQEIKKTFGYDTILVEQTQGEAVFLYEKEGEVLEFTERNLPDPNDASYVFIGQENQKTSTPKALSFEFYNCDPTTLKTIIRANPGFVLLRKGTVIDKWHYNDLPKAAYFKNLK